MCFMLVMLIFVYSICTYIRSTHCNTPLYRAHTDTAEDVKRKIKKAYCPPEIVEKNPIMDYAKHIIFGYYGTITVNSQEVLLRTCICEMRIFVC